MKSVTLPGTSLTTSALGYGCAGLMGISTDRDRLKLLETAFDGGVRHFDTARAYGYGEAERLLGKFIRTRRAQVTVTTKFGIQPPDRVAGFPHVLNVARRFGYLSPRLRKFMSRQARRMVTTGAFSVAEARASLDTSLRELDTDYIDIYLAHEASLADTRSDGLLEFLEGAIRQGKIRYLGIGGAFGRVLTVVTGNPRFARVVQFGNSLLSQNMQLLPQDPDRAVITYGALGEDYRYVQQFLATHDDTARRWSETLGVDCRDPAVVAALLLRYAVHANANGVVLFSTRSRERLEANLDAAFNPVLPDEQMAALVDPTRALPPRTTPPRLG